MTWIMKKKRNFCFTSQSNKLNILISPVIEPNTLPESKALCCFLRALKENRAQSRLLYLLIVIHEITCMKIEMNLHAFLTLCGYLPKLFQNQNRGRKVRKVKSTVCHSVPSCRWKRTRRLLSCSIFFYVCSIIHTRN